MADGDPDTNADAVSAGLAAGKDDGEPLAVDPTQPAATKAVSATTALLLRQPRPLTNLDSTACPSEDHCSDNTAVTPRWKAVLWGFPADRGFKGITGSDAPPRARRGASSR